MHGIVAQFHMIRRRLVLLVCLIVCLPATAILAADVHSSTARGYLTTPQELAEIKRLAGLGEQPYAATVQELFEQPALAVPQAWIGSGRLDKTPVCSDGSQRNAAGRLLPRGPSFLLEGGRLTYAKLLVAHLRDGALAEEYARDARSRILQLADTKDWGGSNYSGSNQCILYLSWYVPGFVMAADLLESFPQIWSADDKLAFQRWLAREVYPKAAWASRARTNNWGSGGSYAAAMIADYVHDAGLTLEEVAPIKRSLSPAQAYREHTREQLSRMSTVVTPRDRQDSQCLPYKGIQPGGGIPDELRRADVGDPERMCRATHLPMISAPYRSAYTYHMAHVEALIAHAELALRRGDPSLYDHAAADGSGSILQAIKFIIANPTNPSASYEWESFRKAQLYVAYSYYRDPALMRQLRNDSLRGGEIVTYARLTHGAAPGIRPSTPITTPEAGEPPPAPAREVLELSSGVLVAGGTWSLNRGVYTLSNPVRAQPGAGLGNLAIHAAPDAENIVFTARAQVRAADTGFSDVAIVFGYQDDQNYAYVSLNEQNDTYTSGIFTVLDGEVREEVDILTPIRPDAWYTVQVTQTGANIAVYLNGELVAEASNVTINAGRVGYGTLNDAAIFYPLRLEGTLRS